MLFALQVMHIVAMHTLRKKLSFPLRIFSVNMTKSAVSWSHLLKKSFAESFMFCAVILYPLLLISSYLHSACNYE